MNTGRAGAIAAEELHASPNPLASHYSRFRVSERLLLTGHSHQAWPDRGFEGQQRAWLDAAALLDEKWERAFDKAERVRRGFRRLLGDADGAIALAESTHDLLVKFLSALPLRDRPRVVVTNAEFHAVRRQLDRLAEEGLEVVRVPAHPAAEAGERVAAAIDDRTAAAIVSSVLFAEEGRFDCELLEAGSGGLSLRPPDARGDDRPPYRSLGGSAYRWEADRVEGMSAANSENRDPAAPTPRESTGYGFPSPPARPGSGSVRGSMPFR